MQLKLAWASCLVLFGLLLGAAPLHGACVANADTLCLNSQRFEVKVAWTDFQGHTGVGKAVPLTSDTGYFWFFSATNVELVIKVLDGRGVNGKFWVFYGALSSVQYTVTVRDTQSGAVRTYLNPSGTFGSVGDTQAFSLGASPVTQSSPVASALAASPWPMFRGNLLHTGRSAYSGPSEATLKWSYRMSGTVGGSPVIGTDGTVYSAAYFGILSALRPDGTLKWAFPTGGLINTASPAIASDDTIYIGSSDSNLYAIRPDGSLQWTYTTGGGIDSSPAIGLNGTVYFGAGDGKVYGVRADGTLKWAYQTGGLIRSSPAIGVDGTIYIGSSDRSFYAFRADGTLKWKYDTPGYVTGSPAIAPDGTVYFVYNNGKMVALRSDGTLKWETIPYIGGFIARDSSPAIAPDGTVYVGSYNGNLYAIRPDGTVKWSYATGSDVTSSPAIAADGTIYVGSNDQKLYAIRSDGTLKWSYTTGSSVGSSPAIGSDGTVYFGSNDQSLYAIGAPPCNGPQTLCLNNDRFKIEVNWKDFQGHTGRGQAVQLTSDTGYFWFFNSANVEVVIKALDARPVNDRYWIFYGALSSVEYIITVTDTVTGAVKMFRNPSGTLASVGDTDAFQDPGPACTQPSITAQPQSTSIVSGSAATLSVQATGTATRYQWFIGTSGDPGSPIVDATGPTYRTPASTTTRSYWVLVTNRCGSANSATATVSVNAPPTVGGLPFKIGGVITPTNVGADYDFDVAATGDMLLAWIARPDSGPIDLSIFGHHRSLQGTTGPVMPGTPPESGWVCSL